MKEKAGRKEEKTINLELASLLNELFFTHIFLFIVLCVLLKTIISIIIVCEWVH